MRHLFPNLPLFVPWSMSLVNLTATVLGPFSPTIERTKTSFAVTSSLHQTLLSSSGPLSDYIHHSLSSRTSYGSPRPIKSLIHLTLRYMTLPPSIFSWSKSPLYFTR